jgi:hypothetical protein
MRIKNFREAEIDGEVLPRLRSSDDARELGVSSESWSEFLHHVELLTLDTDNNANANNNSPSSSSTNNNNNNNSGNSNSNSSTSNDATSSDAQPDVANSSSTQLLDLPHYTQFFILEHLTFRSFFVIPLVCKTWYSIFHERSVWRSMCLNSWRRFGLDPANEDDTDETDSQTLFDELAGRIPPNVLLPLSSSSPSASSSSSSSLSSSARVTSRLYLMNSTDVTPRNLPRYLFSLPTAFSSRL